MYIIDQIEKKELWSCYKIKYNKKGSSCSRILFDYFACNPKIQKNVVYLFYFFNFFKFWSKRLVNLIQKLKKDIVKHIQHWKARQNQVTAEVYDK